MNKSTWNNECTPTKVQSWPQYQGESSTRINNTKQRSQLCKVVKDISWIMDEMEYKNEVYYVRPGVLWNNCRIPKDSTLIL